MTQAIPYNLKPKATKLAEGPDDSLDPPVPPTDAEKRGIPPVFWAAIDKSKGGTAPPDAPLAPPAIDPARRTVPVLDWARGLPERLANRALRETLTPVTLDPDIALWQAIIVSIWPFQGPPDEGSWPKGWFGIDNTAQPYVCTVAGEPGTWAPVGFASAGVISFNTRTGAVVLELADVQAVDYLPTPSAPGEILASTGAAPGDWGWGGLSSDAASLAVDFSVPSASVLTTFLTTASLSVGTWLIQLGALASITTNGAQIEAVAGTATATLVGNMATEVNASSTTLGASLSFKAVVTVAGTLVFQAKLNDDGSVVTLSAATMNGYAGATGYTAVKIA